MAHDEFINIQVVEPTLRRYQVFPGRTHPYMNGTAGGGFLLSATRVFSNEQVVSVKRRTAATATKRKAEDELAANEETKKAKSEPQSSATAEGTQE